MTMLRSLCLALPVAALAACAGTPTAPLELDRRPAAEALPVMTQALLDALPHDPAPWQRYLSETALYVSEAGDVATKAELLEGFGPFPPGLSGTLKLQLPRITEYGDLATMVFDAQEAQTVYGQTIAVRYLSSHVWRREQDRWRLVLAHNAVRAADPAPTPVNARKLREFAGTYDLSGQRQQEIAVRDGTLVAGPPGGPMRALIAVGDNVFVEAGSPLAVLRIFVRDARGRVTKMIQRRKFADLEWVRKR